MNENDINVLLDHFVGALDSSESASVTQKINTLPLWSKTYKQINQVFGGLNSLKEEDSKQPAPEGLANKTFQSILEQSKSHQTSSEFIAQKSASTEQSVRPASGKRFSPVKPSVLVISACAGFLFIVGLFSTSFLGSSNNTTSNPSMGFASSNTSSNNSTDFAVTGSSQQPSSSLFFCSDSVADSANQIPFSNEGNNNFAVNSSEQLVDLSGSSVYPAVEHRENSVKMACPDGFVVFSSQPEGRPIIVVQPRHLPGELKDIQNVVNQQNANFVVPVNYQK